MNIEYELSSHIESSTSKYSWASLLEAHSGKYPTTFLASCFSFETSTFFLSWVKIFAETWDVNAENATSVTKIDDKAFLFWLFSFSGPSLNVKF